MTAREQAIREELAETVERLLEEGGEERLVQFILGELELEALLATLLVRIRDWEEDSDALIELVLGSDRIPWWIPKSYLRRKLDQALPELLLNPILHRLLVEDGVVPERPDLYAYLNS